MKEETGHFLETLIRQGLTSQWVITSRGLLNLRTVCRRRGGLELLSRAHTLPAFSHDRLGGEDCLGPQKP